MTAVMSPRQSPTSSPHLNRSPSPNFNQPALPPLNTSHPIRRAPQQRPPSYARNRMSSYSTTSRFSENRSRPASYAFPAYHSSLSYALVRDFAYPIVHPWHYGPPPDLSEAPSGNTTPASERQRRLSDPANATWDATNPQLSAGPWGGDGFFSNQQLPQTVYSDGPPYSEDEDLHSPVVVSSRHKKHKSTFAATGSRQGKASARSPELGMEEEHESLPLGQGGEQYSVGINGDGMNRKRIREEDEDAHDREGEAVAHETDEGSPSLLAPNTYAAPEYQDPQSAATLPNRSYLHGEADDDSDQDESGDGDPDRDSRYSRDYQFTIASPDEEMHGKAVALFDFARENENELPLKEGQVIWVSYRHGQGWLVAEDPRTGDAGLVPEEYVRLLRDIEGGWSSLSGEHGTDESAHTSPTGETYETAIAPAEAESGRTHTPQASNGTNGSIERRPPIVSSFSTSSRDLRPYPHHLLGEQAGGTPPQVVHYGSPSSTPTAMSPSAGIHGPRGFEEIRGGAEEADTEADK